MTIKQKYIIAGASNKTLAKNVGALSNFHYIDACSSRFADGEIKVNIEQNVMGKDIIILQSLSSPINDNIMELLLIADAVARAGAAKIIAVIPYYGYGRQDKKDETISPIAASLVANLIAAANITTVITVDLHSKQQEGFFRMPLHHLSAQEIFLSVIEQMKYDKNNIVISPDVGGIARAKKISKILNVDFGCINKYRNQTNECEAHEIIGVVKGKNCFIIDDIVDTGNTIATVAKLLKEHEALYIYAFITHAILSAGSTKMLEGAPIEQVYFADTIETNQLLPSKFKILSIAQLIADAIASIFT